jgi:hypothetical protein
MYVLWKCAALVCAAVLIGLFVLLTTVGAERLKDKTKLSSTVMELMRIAPPSTASFFFDVLTIQDTGLIKYQGRELGTDEEVFWGLQQMIGFSYDQEKWCSRKDALAALHAAYQLQLGPQNRKAHSTFLEGYHKCFPPT